ncbi:hypothetical protein [Bacillus cereus group sp. IBL03679]
MKIINVNGVDKEVDFIRIDSATGSVTIYFKDNTLVSLADVNVIGC